MVHDTKVLFKSDSTVKSHITEINSIDSTVSAIKFAALSNSEKEIDTGHLPPHTERGGFKKMV